MVIEVLDDVEVFYLCPECEEKYPTYDEAMLCQRKCTRDKTRQIVG